MNKVTRLVFIFLLSIPVAFFVTELDIDYPDLNTKNIQSFLSEYGIIKASLLFIGIYTFSVRPFIPVPPTLYTIAGGLVFGPFLGTALSVIGATLNASITFLIARLLGRSFVDRLLKSSVDTIAQRFSQPGFKTILILRSAPIGPPFDLVSYGSGILKISFAKYFFATLIGIVPATLLFSLFGDLTTDGGVYLVSVFFMIVVISVVLPWLLKNGKL